MYEYWDGMIVVYWVSLDINQMSLEIV